MKRKKVLLSLFVTLLLLSFITSGCGDNQQAGTDADNPIVLKYAFFAPANTFPAQQMEKWKEEVENRTNNRVKVELFPGGTILTDKNMYDGVKNGVVEMGLSSTTYEPGRFPLLGISDLPSGYPNATVASKVVYDLIQEYPPEAFQDFKIITAFATEPNYLMTNFPVSTLQGLQGKRIRISSSVTPVLTQLGASPISMSMAEVPQSLQTGIVEGIVTSREVLKDLKLVENLSYGVDYPLSIVTFVAVMNKNVWDSLPSDIQQVIDELGQEMAIWTGEYKDSHVAESLDWSKNNHAFELIRLSQDEIEAWNQVLQPLQDEYVADLQSKGLPAEAYQERLYELISQYSQ
ncbi:TRAP transporter substrate-binding protein [Heliorestis convoluta]|uniref:TRAP transporter substrate-binding protein n=1 Tax=Heliorestis convoluta TaxID=356322 RepID=A0A5Q2N3Q4_9FIRM|nr:TRAP transporter substrate-binding protein [Heliorestis convoluta]QGG49437.1 TRAP transporter substrate-binding protein [Heliorestis convoluta]